jgi:hypothetical protein
VYISRDVLFDETHFLFAQLHENVGALLRKEIILLPNHLLNLDCGDESCADQLLSDATNTPDSNTCVQEQEFIDTGAGFVPFAPLHLDVATEATDDLSSSGTDLEVDSPALGTSEVAVLPSSATSRSPRAPAPTAGETASASADGLSSLLQLRQHRAKMLRPRRAKPDPLRLLDPVRLWRKLQETQKRQHLH